MAARMRCGSLGSSQNGWSTQLAHRRQKAVAGEIEPVGEPAVLGEEADEVLGERGLPPSLKTTARGTGPRSTSGWPLAPCGHSIVAAFL